MHLGMAECQIPFLGHCDLDLWPSFNNYRVQSILYIIWGRNPKFGMWLQFGMAKCHVSVLWPWLNFYNNRVRSVSQDIIYYLREESQICCIDTTLDADVSHTILGHCDLDLWPSFKNNCVWSISPILFNVGIPNLGCWFLLGWRSGAYHFWSLWFWHWLLASFLGFSCLEHISYITANFPQMCLMLDQFLCGHLSRVCDISCLYVSFFQCLVCLQLIVLV